MKAYSYKTKRQSARYKHHEVSLSTSYSYGNSVVTGGRHLTLEILIDDRTFQLSFNEEECIDLQQRCFRFVNDKRGGEE